MTTRFMVPPNWPTPPAGWAPSQDWQPPAEWGPAPEGWQFWWDDTPQTYAPTPALAETPVPVAPAVASRRSWWRRLGWLLVLVGGAVSFFVVNQTMITTQNVLFFPTVLLIGAVTVPAAVLLLEYAIGQGLEGHGGLIMGTAVIAGIVGVATAGWLEASLNGPQPTVLLGVAIIEETAKMLVPLVIFLVLRRRTAGAGLALGIAAGAGFAVLETMGYAFYALVARNGGLAAMEQTLQLRALLAPASHIAWTGMIAWALWRIDATPKRRFAIPGLAVAFATAVGLHYLWDLTSTTTEHVVLAGISVVVLITLMVLSARRAKVRAREQYGAVPSMVPVLPPVMAGPVPAGVRNGSVPQWISPAPQRPVPWQQLNDSHPHAA